MTTKTDTVLYPSEALTAFYDINWVNEDAARHYYFAALAQGQTWEDALRETECGYTQRMNTTPARTESERGRIQRAYDTQSDSLERATELLQMIELEHQRGEDWVHINDAPATAVGILKRLGMLKVIHIDGAHRAQLKGAFK